jgi:hypothetical protein
MPAVMIRQLDALTKIIAETSDIEQRRVLLDQAAMISRASERSVPEESDRTDIQRQYDELLAADDRSRRALAGCQVRRCAGCTPTVGRHRNDAVRNAEPSVLIL